MILDTVSKSLQILLGGAAATTECPIVSSYEDRNKAGVIIGAASNDTITTGATAVAVVAAPVAGKVRVVKAVSLFNADTAPVVVTVRLLNGATPRKLMTVTLAVGSSLLYTETAGWRVLTSGGQLVETSALDTTLAVSLLATVNGINAKTVAVTTLYTVPAGKSLIVDHVVIRCTAFTVGAKAVQAVASFGGNATWDDYLNSVTYTVAAVNTVITDSLEDTAVPVFAAGATFKLTIETGADPTTETWSVALYGTLL